MPEARKVMERGATPEPAQILDEKIGDYALQGAIYAAAKLGISDLLKNGPMSYQDIATRLGANARAALKTMHYLSDHGIFTEVQYGVFSLNDVGRLLQSGMRREEIILDFEIRRPVSHDLLYALMTGASAFKHVHGMGWYELCERDSTFEDSFVLNMTRSAAKAAPSILAAYNFAVHEVVVDVGGNIGILLSAILKAYPKTRGTLFDRASIIEKAREFMKKEELRERCELVSGNFLEQVPKGGDLYILKWVLPDWTDTDFVRILRNCREAMKPNGRVLIIEWILTEDTKASAARTLDHWMLLIGVPGCRTLSEVNRLFLDAGFKPCDPVTTDSGFAIIEGIPV